MGVVSIAGPIPGPKSRALNERRAAVVAPGVGLAHPIAIASAHGATVTDVDGNVFLDFAGGIGCLNVGHTHDAVVAAARAQLERFTHGCFQVTSYEGYVAVCEQLVRLAPVPKPSRAMLVSTGAEAVENAVKIARRATGRPAVLAFEHAFHGRTLLGMSLTGKAHPYKTGFGPMAGEIYRLPFPPPADLDAALLPHVHPSQLAAVIVEPVVGEGGFLPLSAAAAAGLRAFCDKHGVVLIADEVQSGMGRTGRVFASEQLGLAPDLVTCAKSLAGGLPLAGVVGRADIVDKVHAGGLGGTFAGNPVACAAALAALAAIEEVCTSGAAERLGALLHGALKAVTQNFPAIREVRGVGAMLAMELADDQVTKRVLAEALARGLILLSAGTHGNVVRFLPALTISNVEVVEAMAILADALIAAKV